MVEKGLTVLHAEDAVEDVLAAGNHPNHGHTRPYAYLTGATEGDNEFGASAPMPGVTSVILTRDHDGALIPYVTLHGITLITGLRAGLLPALKVKWPVRYGVIVTSVLAGPSIPRFRVTPHL